MNFMSLIKHSVSSSKKLNFSTFKQIMNFQNTYLSSTSRKINVKVMLFSKEISQIQLNKGFKGKKNRLFRMIRSQKPRKNWTLGDRNILDWVVMHHALFKKYKNIEKEFVKIFLFRRNKTGFLLPSSFQVPIQTLVCSNGLVSIKQTLTRRIGAKKSHSF